MSDRGEYRAVRRVLLDGPDFQRQSMVARWVFVALKLNFGPAGIEVWYPAELAARLSEQTGASVAGIQEALISLERDGWIQREANVVWIVEQLQFDPHVTPANPKHRTMLESHLAGLPTLGIVTRFVLHYADWFRSDGKPTGDPSPRLRKALDTVSHTASDTVSNPSRSTENKPEDKPEDNSLGSSDDDPGDESGSDAELTAGAKRTSRTRKAPASTTSWITPFAEAWLAAYGGPMPIEPALRPLRQVVKAHGAEEVLRRWTVYLAGTEGQYASASRFASTWDSWSAAGDPRGGAQKRAAAIGVAPAAMAEAVTLWERYARRGLLQRLPRDEYDQIGKHAVADGEYASVEAFLEELRVTQPWSIQAKNDGYGINELARRLSQPRRASA